MAARKWVPFIKGWILLGDALDGLETLTGSRERAEQEMCEHLRAGPERLTSKYWRQGEWKDAEPTYWTVENMRKVQSVDGVDQGGKLNYFFVKLSRFLDLYPAARKPSDEQSAQRQAELAPLPGQREETEIATPPHPGGAPGIHMWDGAKKSVDDYVAERGPLPRKPNGKPIVARAVDLMIEWFEKNDPRAPARQTIYKWIKKNSVKWWGSD